VAGADRLPSLDHRRGRERPIPRDIDDVAQMLDEIRRRLCVTPGRLLCHFGAALSIVFVATAHWKDTSLALKFYLFHASSFCLLGMMWYNMDIRLTKDAKDAFRRGGLFLRCGWWKGGVALHLHAMWHVFSAAGTYDVAHIGTRVLNTPHQFRSS
jgi:hypothetical protein